MEISVGKYVNIPATNAKRIGIKQRCKVVSIAYRVESKKTIVEVMDEKGAHREFYATQVKLVDGNPYSN